VPARPPHSVVCFGEALIDFLARPESDSRTPQAFVQYAGGAPANVAVAVARLGGRAQFVGMLGQDMFGDFLLDSLRSAGVDTTYVARTAQARTALAFVSLDENGERHFSFYRPPSADLLFAPVHFHPRCFEEMGIFHLCSNSLTQADIALTTIQGMRRARESGALVSMDMNFRPALWPVDCAPHVRLWDALRNADLVKLAQSELDFLAADSGNEALVLAELWRGRAQWVIVTDGAAPIRWYSRSRRGSVATFAMQVVDTTAAGDAFMGGLLYRLAECAVDAKALPDFIADTPASEDALRFGAAVGALAVTRHGAFAAMPTLSEVQRLLREAA
jgi:fructokinase